MDILLVILAVVCALVGLIGAVMPVLPGTPISFLALLFTAILYGDEGDFPVLPIIMAGVIAFIVMLLDYIVPIWLANRTGGSKYGMWGMSIGLFVGLFGGITGILLCPFLGALIGELLAKTPGDKALKIALMSFVGFMLTTGIKLIYSIAAIVIVWSLCGFSLWEKLF